MSWMKHRLVVLTLLGCLLWHWTPIPAHSHGAPPRMRIYLYAHADPVNGTDPSGNQFLPSTLAGGLLAVGLATINVGIISQVSVNYQKFFTLSTSERVEAIEKNMRTIGSLKRIIDSNGLVTFQQENLGVGGTLGMKLPGNSALRRAANLWEALRNIYGYPTALEELFARLGNRGIRPIPLPDDQTDEQRAALAEAFLHRQEAFDRWLRRDY